MALDLGIMSALSIACQSHAAMVGRHRKMTVDLLADLSDLQHIVATGLHQRYWIAPDRTDGG